MNKHNSFAAIFHPVDLYVIIPIILLRLSLFGLCNVHCSMVLFMSRTLSFHLFCLVSATTCSLYPYFMSVFVSSFYLLLVKSNLLLLSVMLFPDVRQL